jgi:ABC-2 type transport system ATP-binding protein
MEQALALQVHGVGKRYRQSWRRSQVVLDDLELTVARGEAYGLLGKNGAGKSTTFRLVMGLARPDTGAIRLLDGSPGDREVKLRLGYCPENPQFPPGLTVTELLRYHASLVGDRILASRNRIDWLLIQLDLEAYRNKPVRTLSRGTLQRLALALALLARPDMLILDEPLTGLDPIARHTVIGLLRELKGTGTTMLVSSHILSELECLADKLGILAGGRIQKEIAVGVATSPAYDILVPFERGKEIIAEAPELMAIREDQGLRFGGLSFAQAQELVQRWSTAGIPILALKPGGEIDEEEILASFAATDAERVAAAPGRPLPADAAVPDAAAPSPKPRERMKEPA